MIEHLYHKDVKKISINKCQDRNFYCPKSIGDKKDVYKNGSRLLLLNGTWDFKYYKSHEKYNDLDTFNDITVPSCWQSSGYGDVCYVNDRYLIDIKPPYVDDSDFGVYKKRFLFNKLSSEKYYLNIEGKDSSVYVYINNSFVGFDSVSHMTSEFDITDYLVDGENEIMIFVYVSCVGTYFECQDKFRLSGLFRDIYILKRPVNHITNYHIDYSKQGSIINTTITFGDNYDKTINLYYLDKLILSIKGNSIISFSLDDIKLWNAEEPNHYLLEIICNEEYIYDYICYRFVELKNNILYLNDTKIKILGINHHDSNYLTGYYLSLDDYKKDIEIMKSDNINAIRTSHYPKSPEFLFLTDEYGLYVMDEADMECHGSVYMNGEYDINTFDRITDNEVFREVILDRVNRMMDRDYNRKSVIFWSPGNETGFGKEIINALKMMKEKDNSRLIHFESLYTDKPEKNNYRLDFISQMYSSIDKMKDTLKEDDRALLLCEYSHSMGNSSGDIHDYIEYFDKEDRVMGGFVWEYNDHLFPIDLDENKPGYGGDFNEKVHSSNFCVDGTVTYKRTPHSNLLEIKEAYSRVKIRKIEHSYYLENLFDFIDVDSSFYIELRIKDFKEIDKTIVFDNIRLKPHEKTLLYKNTDLNSVLTFTVYRNNNEYSKISFIEDEFKYEIHNDLGVIEGCFDSNNFILSGNDMSIHISKETGIIDKVLYKEKEITSNWNLNLLRAPIDNDQYEIEYFKKTGLFDYKVKLIDYCYSENTLKVNVLIDDILNGTITYSLNSNNILSINTNVSINKDISYLPRLGYSIKTNKEYKDYEYLGYGPHESYIDKHYLDTFDMYKDSISDEIDYVKPQETMSHYLVKMLEISGINNIVISGMNSFSYLKYSLDELINKKHNYELESDSYNHLSLDYFMSGIGSHSCGPELDEAYKLTEKDIDFTLIIEVKNGNN